MNLIIFFAILPLQIIHNVSNQNYKAFNLNNSSSIATEDEFTRFYGDDQRSITNKTITKDSRDNNFDKNETNAYNVNNFDNGSEIHYTDKVSIDEERNENITKITDDSAKYRLNFEFSQYNNTLTNLQNFRTNKKRRRTVEIFKVSKKFYHEIFQGNEEYFLIVTVPIVAGFTLAMVCICYRLRAN